MKHMSTRGEKGSPCERIYLRGLGHSFAEYFDFEVAEGGVERYGLFASEIGREFDETGRTNQIITMMFRQAVVETEGKRLNRFVGSKHL
jgi:hypothetical protein